MEHKRGLDRRSFLTGTLSGIASFGLAGAARGSSGLVETPQPPTSAKRELITRALGKTGITLPIVSMGVMNASNPELVRKSYEIGVRHFDTAAYYQQGRNEEMVGRVIKELNARDHVVIATKIFIPEEQRGMVPEKAKAFYLKTADECLQRLQTDHVDILYSHNVWDVQYLNNPGIIDALQTLKKQGKARFIGFSTHRGMTECLRDAVRSGVWDVILTAFNYAMDGDADLVQALKDAHGKGIGLVAMKTQCSQYWYKEHLPEETQKYYEGSIHHAAVLKWVLKHDYIHMAIPGYTTFEQMDMDFKVASSLEYTPEEQKFLSDRKVKLAMAYCRQCGHCVTTCPSGVDVPTLMRTHLYATIYGNFHAAREAMKEIPHKKSFTNCLSCSDCRAVCANRIDIAKRVEDLRTIYG